MELIKKYITNKYAVVGILLGLVVSMATLASCTKTSDEKISTGKIIPSAIMPAGFKGDAAYAEVNSKWLTAFYDRWRTGLFNKGVTKWEGRFDCNRFATSYCAEAQLEYYRDNFQSWTTGQALAVGEIWYMPDTGGGHAVVMMVTDTGTRFLEPQTGKIINLSPKEQRSIFFSRF